MSLFEFHMVSDTRSVPGGLQVDYDELCSGGEGAGPDCFSCFFLRVLGANCKARFVISCFSLILSVICTATALTEMKL
jgi:hypothetical protein